MWDDDRLQREAESQRISAGEHYRKAVEADRLGNAKQAEAERERAAYATRRAELYERLIGRWTGPGRYTEVLSIDTDEALKLLDRFDSHPVGEVLTHAEGNKTAEAGLKTIQSLACTWAFGNEVRAGAMREIVRMVKRIEATGAEVNIAALARMTGISRQTLHARLRAPQ
ncbi:hypothetical protein ACWEN3_25765 [Streptomyces sp. NPDC004561]